MTQRNVDGDGLGEVLRPLGMGVRWEERTLEAVCYMPEDQSGDTVKEDREKRGNYLPETQISVASGNPR